MELAKFCACMDEIAPRGLALDFDNVGLLVEPDHTEIKKVLIALDCTTVTAREAIDLGVDLLVTHHPQFFHGVKSIGFSSPITGAAALLLRHGIGHFGGTFNHHHGHIGNRRQIYRAGNQRDIIPCIPGGFRQSIPHFTGGAVGQKSHGIQLFPGGPGCNKNLLFHYIIYS